MKWLPTGVPTTHDEESVSDVIVLREEIPETADVVAPLDAGHQPRFTARCGGGCRRRGHQPQEEGNRPPAPTG